MFSVSLYGVRRCKHFRGKNLLHRSYFIELLVYTVRTADTADHNQNRKIIFGSEMLKPFLSLVQK